ncbi:MAG: response regulator [Proteobacteria bacterium]|nr:response regulator [Pseudomonadota bacterium]
MDQQQHDMAGGASLPSQQEHNRQAFVRYLPRRIADFERRILRCRFAGWEPNSLVVLAGDAHRLADASANYALDVTHAALLALARCVGGFAASMRGPDPKQTEHLFALLASVLRSLPTTATTPAQGAAPSAATAKATPDDAVATAVAADAATDAPVAQDGAPPLGDDAVTTPAIGESIATASMADTLADADAAIAVDRACEEDSTQAAAIDTPGAFATPESHAAALSAPSPEADSAADSASAMPAASTVAAAIDEAIDETIAHAAAASASGQPMPTAEPSRTQSPIETAEASAAATVAEPARHAGVPAIDPAGLDDADELDMQGGIGMHRVFFLSDGNAFARELGERLEARGFAVESVDCIEELSEMLTCLMPHTLLVDASQASRLAIVGALRRDAQHHAQPPSHIQMILMAPQDSLPIRRAAYRAGADLLLFPPFDAGGVSERLHALHAANAAEPVRVLVVDDQRADALFAQTVLERAGMRARVEHDPLRVTQTLAAERADLILMDLHMPYANGVEVTMLLREDPQFARIPIVFLSGESDLDSRLEAINAGGDDFLFKPIRPRHLIAAVRDRVRRLHAVERSTAPS